MKTFNMALVGCGVISANHLNAVSKLNNVKVVALCDVEPERAEARREKFSLDCSIYTNYYEMLESEKLDAVHITTPHYLHFPMAKAALEKGINVFLEKPACISNAELDELMRIEKESSAKLCVSFQTRYNPATQLAKKIAAEDGGVLRAYASLFWNRDNAYYATGSWRGRMETEGGGVLINQAIHTLDFICCLMGKPVSVIASTSNHCLDKTKYDVEDTADGLVRFENGTTANFYATNSFPGNDNVSVVFYTKNHRVEVQSNKIYLDGYMINDPSLSAVYYGKQVYGNGHECLIAKYYEALENDTPVPIDLEGSQDPLRLLLAVYASNNKETPV